MILKFRTMGSADSNFQFIDGVSDLTTVKGDRTLFSGRPPEEVDCWWEDEEYRDKDTTYSKLSWKDKDGRYRCFVTHLPTYLLNDAGKTIERLV